MDWGWCDPTPEGDKWTSVAASLKTREEMATEPLYFLCKRLEADLLPINGFITRGQEYEVSYSYGSHNTQLEDAR